MNPPEKFIQGDDTEFLNHQNRLEPAVAQKVLLVDDDPINLNILLMMLENLGYSVDTAASGLEALQVINSKPYQIILMDQQMPGISGLETVERLRQNNLLWPRPYIIILSADSRWEIQEKLLQAGADLFLAKPFTLETIQNALAQAGHAAWQSTDASNPHSKVEGVSIDERILSDLFTALSGDDASIVRILDLFLKNAPALMETIKAQAASHQLMELKASLHSFQGSCELYGAVRLASLIKSLGRQFQEGLPDDLDDQIKELDVEFIIVHNYLTEVRSKQQPDAG